MMNNDQKRHLLEQLNQLIPDAFTSEGKLRLSGLKEYIGKENISPEKTSLDTIDESPLLKKAEDALRKNEERLKALINASPNFICFKDELGRWQADKQAAIDLFSLQNIDYIRKTDAEIAQLADPAYINAKLRTVARLYALHSQINQAILHITNEQELLQAICRVAIQYGQFRMAWIGIKNETDDIVKPAFFAGHEEDYLKQLQIIAGDKTTGRGPSGQALMRGQISSCYDIASDPQMLPWREEALKRGYRSSAAVPFRRKGKVIGILNLYASEPGFFTQDEQNMLQEIGDNITFALNAIDSETERKQAVEALQKSEALFRAIVDASPDDITITDLSGNIILVSAVALTMFGYESLEEIVGMNLSNFIIPDDHERAFANISLLFQGQRTSPAEYTGVRKDGSLFDIEANGQLICNADGQPIQMVLIVRDITQRKLTQEALIESETKYRELVENSTDAIIIQKGGIIIYANNESLNLLAASDKTELIGRHILEFIHPDYQAFVIERMKKVTADEPILPVAEKKYVRIDGSEVDVEVKAMTIKLGNELAVQVIVRDITKRKQTEKILKEHHLQLERMVKERTTKLEQVLGINRAIVDNAGIAIFSTDKRGYIRSVNPFAERLCGFSADEIIGKPLSILFRKPEQEALFGKSNKNAFISVRRYLQNIITNQNAVRETSVLCQSGETTPVLFSFSILRNAKEMIDGFVGVATDISSRKKAEMALKKSQRDLQLRETYLSSVIQNHPGRFWLKDIQGRFLFSNKTNDRFMHLTLGLKDSNIIEKTESDLRTPQQAQRILKEDQKVISHKRTLIQEEQFQIGTNDLWYEKLKFPVIDQNGETIGVAGYAIDITNRKEQEALLRMQSEAFESFSLSIVITDKEGRIQWTNRAFQELTGYSPKEAIGKKPSILQSGKTDSGVFTELWETILAGQVWSGEFFNKRKDGSLYQEETTITPVRNAFGEISRFIAIKVDISHRKEMEEALRLSEERWQFALEGAGDGIWDWNLQSNAVFYSKQWKKMLGYEDQDIENHIDSWKNLIHPEDLSRCLNMVSEYFKGNIPLFYFEHRLRCKDKSYKWVLSRGKIMERILNGKPLRIIGTHTDITEIKLAEEKLKESIEREKELNDIKSRFVANASHEFRTPLATILLANDSLISYWKKMEEDQIRDKLEKIRNNAIHLTHIVNDILQLSKIEEGKIEFNPRQIDILSLCKTIIDEFRGGQYSNEIRFDCAFESLIVSADERLMRQALNNLLSNAMKYSPNNLPIEVRIQKHGDEITIHVTDHGIGIPEADQKHLFTPFFRASNSKLIQGNGLGLNILRESIRLHGGDITFTSKMDEGSSFVLHLPVNRIINLTTLLEKTKQAMTD